MKITVFRTSFDSDCTQGTMSIDGVFECYTLEPPVQGVKPYAIPTGTYPVSITFSGHFQRDMPLVNDVPGFTEIRIHPGNWASDTEGCCLVGEMSGKDEILRSVLAFDPLFAKIKAAIDSGEGVTIEYGGES